jgi:2,4-dienoyl-CoA reductase-like NADH-dependent reductase (Old Yellow Enzyme family)
VDGTQPTLEHVWQPLDIGPTRVRNRIMVTAQTLLYGRDHILSDRHIAFYRERAKGGAALLVTEQQAAHRLSKGSFHAGCTVWEERAIPQLEKLADAVHEHGAKQFVQLFGCGVHDKGTTIFDEWHPLWGVSRAPSIVHREVPLVMGREEIDDVVRGFGVSAKNVEVSGLDGVEIHGAHGYLVGQFLSRAYNFRTDEYGGSTANRCRFALEIAAEIRRRVGDAITVGIRLTFDEFIGAAGITPDEAEEQLELLAASGLFDYFSVTGGAYHSFATICMPMHAEEGYMTSFGKRAKDVVGDRGRVFVVGRIVDIRMAEQIVGDGWADMVAMTRAHLADPFLVAKTRSGHDEEIVRCIGANVCVSRAVDQQEVACVMNPVAGREAYWGDGSLVRADRNARRIVVVGGGPSGMRAAGVAATRGHEVILVEAEEELGGHLNVLKRLPTRGLWQRGIDNLVAPLTAHAVEIRLGLVATPVTLAALEPATIICATGASWDRTGLTPLRPDREAIPGWDQENVVDIGLAARRAIDDPLCLGRHVLIGDESGTYLPLGLAELLADAGVSVEIVTPNLFIGEETLKTGDMYFVLPRLTRKGVRLTTQTMIERISGTSATLVGIWGGAPEERLVETVVVSTYRTPDNHLFSELNPRFPDVRRLGDAVAPRRVEAVVYEAEKLGREL